MEIQEIVDIESKIISKKLVYTFTLKNCEITQLRVLKTIECIKTILDTLFLEDVKNVCFVFVIDELIIPANYEYIKDLTDVFSRYEEIVKEKVKFSIIQSNSSVFQLLFSIIKKYYIPIKPLYVCSKNDDVVKCLSNKKEREKYQNVSDMIK